MTQDVDDEEWEVVSKEELKVGEGEERKEKDAECQSGQAVSYRDHGIRLSCIDHRK